MIKRTPLLLLLAGIAGMLSPRVHAEGGQPFLLTRSQSFNLARNHAGISHFLHRDDAEGCFHGLFAVTAAYQQSFNNQRTAECLLGSDVQGCDDDIPVLKISGSRAADRNETDWLGDYFGLPTDFKSEIELKPRMRSGIFDIRAQVHFAPWVCRMWAAIYAPIVHVRTRLNPCETVVKPGSQGYVEGYFGNTAYTQNGLLKKATDFFAGSAVELKDASVTTTGVSVIVPLAYSRWARDEVSTTNLGDLRMELGWDAIQNECYNFGLYLAAAAPTGNRPDAIYFFEPIAGNGRHWEVGGGINAHARLWERPECERRVDLYFDAQVMHMFSSHQRRTFDLKNNPNSRYMLAQGLVSNVNDVNKLNAPSDAGLRFNGVFTPVANLTTLDVSVKMDFQADVVVKLVYTREGFNFDLGYNYWGTSCEKICQRCPSILEDTAVSYALKGDAHVVGFEGTTNIPLAATQSKATINSGTNFVGGVAVATAQTNPAIDNPQLATTSTGVVNSTTVAPVAQTNSSNAPELITLASLDMSGTKGQSHTLFMNINYQWDVDECCLVPFFGIGGSAEFGSREKETCGKITASNCEDSCHACSLSQWSLWLKAGFIF